MQLFTRYSQISQIENFETLTEALYGKRTSLKAGEADPALDVEPIAVVDNAAPPPVDEQGEAVVVQDGESYPDPDQAEGLPAKALRLSKDERVMLEMDDLNKHLTQMLEDNAQLQEENATLQKQVEAIKDDGRPQLSAGVAQIAAVKHELATCKQGRMRADVTIKDLKRENQFLKRRLKELEERFKEC